MFVRGKLFGGGNARRASGSLYFSLPVASIFSLANSRIVRKISRSERNDRKNEDRSSRRVIGRSSRPFIDTAAERLFTCTLFFPVSCENDGRVRGQKPPRLCIYRGSLVSSIFSDVRKVRRL